MYLWDYEGSTRGSITTRDIRFGSGRERGSSSISIWPNGNIWIFWNRLLMRITIPRKILLIGPLIDINAVRFVGFWIDDVMIRQILRNFEFVYELSSVKQLKVLPIFKNSRILLILCVSSFKAKLKNPNKPKE